MNQKRTIFVDKRQGTYLGNTFFEDVTHALITIACLACVSLVVAWIFGYSPIRLISMLVG